MADEKLRQRAQGIRLGMTPTRRVAVAMAAVAAIGIAVYFALGWAKAWLPNIVVGAVTVALTVTVIERAVRGELEQRYVQRRLPADMEVVVSRVRAGFASFDWRVGVCWRFRGSRGGARGLSCAVALPG